MYPLVFLGFGNRQLTKTKAEKLQVFEPDVLKNYLYL